MKYVKKTVVYETLCFIGMMFIFYIFMVVGNL